MWVKSQRGHRGPLLRQHGPSCTCLFPPVLSSCCVSILLPGRRSTNTEVCRAGSHLNLCMLKMREVQPQQINGDKLLAKALYELSLSWNLRKASSRSFQKLFLLNSFHKKRFLSSQCSKKTVCRQLWYTLHQIPRLVTKCYHNLKKQSNSFKNYKAFSV